MAQAQALVVRLVVLAGRGSSLTQVALELADEGLPVPGQTVLDAALKKVRETRSWVWTQLGPRDMLDGADGVAAAASRLAASEPRHVRAMQRRIPRSSEEPDGPGAEAALFAFLAVSSGVGLEELDEPGLHATLHSVNAHGVVEGVGGAEGPRLLPGGVADLVGVLGRFALDNLIKLLERFPADLVHSTLDQTRAFRDWLQAGHDAEPGAAHHLAAETILGGMEGAGGVVVRLLCWQAIREMISAEPAASGPAEVLK